MIMFPAKSPVHYHNELETIQVLEGEVNIIIEGKSNNLTTGQTIVIEPKLQHFAFTKFGCVLLCTTIPASTNFPDVR